MRRGRGVRSYFWKILIVLAVLIVLMAVSYLVWLIFFSSPICYDWDCFNEHLEKCNRANFIGGSKMIFEYNIIGSGSSSDSGNKGGQKCIIDVKLLRGEFNNRDSSRLEGKEMRCEIPKGVVMLPESDMNSCHGRLKEEWQKIVIEKLHSYLVQNLGKLNLEIIDVPLGQGNFTS